MTEDDGREEETVVYIRLAEIAPNFVAAALDLLVAVEEEDEWGMLNAAEKLREIADAGDW